MRHRRPANRIGNAPNSQWLILFSTIAVLKVKADQRGNDNVNDIKNGCHRRDCDAHLCKLKISQFEYLHIFSQTCYLSALLFQAVRTGLIVVAVLYTLHCEKKQMIKLYTVQIGLLVSSILYCKLFYIGCKSSDCFRASVNIRQSMLKIWLLSKDDRKFYVYNCIIVSGLGTMLWLQGSPSFL